MKRRKRKRCEDDRNDEQNNEKKKKNEIPKIFGSDGLRSTVVQNTSLEKKMCYPYRSARQSHAVSPPHPQTDLSEEEKINENTKMQSDEIFAMAHAWNG